MDTRIHDALEEMLSDCREAGLSPIVCSAYRTEETQTRLYSNKVARVRASGVPEDQVEAEAARWVAPPGTSEHQTGLAVDIVAASYQILDERQEDTAEQQWLMENSWRYGFILRYPTGEERYHRHRLRALALPLCGQGRRRGHAPHRGVPGGIPPAMDALEELLPPLPEAPAAAAAPET